MLISLDPSLNKTGYAISDGVNILTSGVIRSRADGEIDKLLELSRGLKDVIGGRDIPAVQSAIVEVPGSFSYARSTGKSGKGVNHSSLGKLNMAIGALCLTLKLWGIEVQTVEAHRWKGKRSKDLDKAIAATYIGRPCGPDEADAVMLMVWHLSGKITQRRMA